MINSGTIVGKRLLGIGVLLRSGGLVTNNSGGTISGGFTGVGITGAAGGVSNSGSIGPTDTYGIAIYLAAGGYVTNAASGTITGGAKGNGFTAPFGVKIRAGTGTVSNQGSISAGTSGVGVALVANGSLSNAVGGTITGAYAGAAFRNGGTVMNAATASIAGGSAGVFFYSGSSATGTVANAGTIAGTSASGVGVLMKSGGFVENNPSGTISGGNGGITINGDVGTVSNSGGVSATGGSKAAAIYMGSGGTISNFADGTISGYAGISIPGAAGTIDNEGAIAATGSATSGISMGAGGGVLNAVGASIAGGYIGIKSTAASVSVTNRGGIVGTADIGVYLAGGTLLNAASAAITGGIDGVRIAKYAGTIVDYGTISAETGIGADLINGGTLTIGGTVTGGSGLGGAAAYLGGAGNNRLVLLPGYAVSGLVTGRVGASNALEFAAATAAGTVAGLGTKFENFGSIVFDAGSNWTIAGNSSTVSGAATVAGTVTVTGTVQDQAANFVNSGAIVINGGVVDVNSGTFDNSGSVTVANHGTFFIANAAAFAGVGDVFMETGSTTEIAPPVKTAAGLIFSDPATLILDNPSTFGGTIGGLDFGDVIALKGETITSGSITGTTLTLDLVGGGTQTLTVAPGESGERFVTTPTGGLEVACFAAGTRILTARGEVAVEHLRIGEMLPTLRDGHSGAVRWLGYRRIDCGAHPRPWEVWPIRVRAGAFAPDVPRRSLLLSPDHAVYVDGVLIPVRYLVNGVSIAQVETASVAYWHLELDRHDVVLAEGLPAESYLDTGNQSAFANAGDAGLAAAGVRDGRRWRTVAASM